MSPWDQLERTEVPFTVSCVRRRVDVALVEKRLKRSLSSVKVRVIDLAPCLRYGLLRVPLMVTGKGWDPENECLP